MKTCGQKLQTMAVFIFTALNLFSTFRVGKNRSKATRCTKVVQLVKSEECLANNINSKYQAMILITSTCLFTLLTFGKYCFPKKKLQRNFT